MLIAFTGSSTSGAITVPKTMPGGIGYSMANAMRNPAVAEKIKAKMRPNRTLLLSLNRSVCCSKLSRREVIVGKKLVFGPWKPAVGLLPVVEVEDIVPQSFKSSNGYERKCFLARASITARQALIPKKFVGVP